jgi:hypothetical protein
MADITLGSALPMRVAIGLSLASAIVQQPLEALALIRQALPR